MAPPLRGCRWGNVGTFRNALHWKYAPRVVVASPRQWVGPVRPCIRGKVSPLCVAAGGAAGPRTPERVRRAQAAGPRHCLRCRGLLGCTDPGSARRLRRRHGAAGDQSTLPPLATGQCPPHPTPKTTLQPFCRLEVPPPPLPPRLSSISPHPSTPTPPLSSQLTLPRLPSPPAPH